MGMLLYRHRLEETQQMESNAKKDVDLTQVVVGPEVKTPVVPQIQPVLDASIVPRSRVRQNPR